MKRSLIFFVYSKQIFIYVNKGKKLLFILAILFLHLLGINTSAQILYSNTGNNTTGFVLQYDGGSNGNAGNANLISNGTTLTEGNTAGGGWYDLPVQVSGNFQISFQVNNNSKVSVQCSTTG